MIVNVAPTAPDDGPTWIGSLTEPVIEVWMLQWYGYEPAKSTVFENELPAAMLPLFHRANGPFCVDVWVMLSLFVQSNVSPMAPVAAARESLADPDDRDVHRGRPRFFRHQQRQDGRRHHRDRTPHAHPLRSSVGVRAAVPFGWSDRVPSWRIS